jgi:hypothetical protein
VPNPTLVELVDRATKWIPTPRVRSTATEELRAASPTTLSPNFKERSLHSTAQSPLLAGYGLARMPSRKSRSSRMRRLPRRMAGQSPGPANQLRFAESSAEVRAATLLTRNVLQELRELGEAVGPIGQDVRMRIRRNIPFANKFCQSWAERLLEAGNTSGHFEPHALPRWGRDIHMGAVRPHVGRTSARGLRARSGMPAEVTRIEFFKTLLEQYP